MKATRIIFPILIITALFGLSAFPESSSQAAPLMDPVNPGTTDLISWWSLDEESGTRNDSHGSNHLTDNNTVTSTVGVVNNAGNFTSANSEYLSISDNTNLSTGEINFSGGCWVNHKTKNISQWITTKGINPQIEHSLYYSNPDDRFVFGTSSNGTSLGSQVFANSNGSVSTSTWYFVVFWHDATNDTNNIQVNNGSVNTLTLSVEPVDRTGIFSIGSRQASYANAYIDECFFYKRLLTADERTWLYNSGNGRSYSELLDPPTATPTNTPVNTATFTPTSTPTNTPTNTATSTNTSTASNTAPGPTTTDTDTPTETLTPTQTLTPTITYTPTITFTPSPTRTPGNIATAFWDGMITYGDAANVTVTSLLCLVVIVGLLLWLATSYLQRRNRK